MHVSAQHILITGQPGVGKTTLIRKLAGHLMVLNPVGFYTAEIRQDRVRTGFELISLAGPRGILSHTDIKSPHRVGKYGVDVKGFEDFLTAIPFLSEHTALIIIDEIGKMECLSGVFRRLIRDILDSDLMCIATISMKGGGLIAEVKNRADVTLFEISIANRDTLIPDILRVIEPKRRDTWQRGSCNQ
ncbi:MAG: nucleoside-triphosphatase [Nitrospirota bacterium]